MRKGLLVSLMGCSVGYNANLIYLLIDRWFK